MSQLTLLTVPPPTLPDGIDLRCCSVEDLLANVDGLPTLVVADPPWSYSNDNASLEGIAGNQYTTNGNAGIASVLANAHKIANKNARLAMWGTWPKLEEWIVETAAMGNAWPWRFVTGGAWTKLGGPGVGFHWLGSSEFCLIYTAGSPVIHRDVVLLNAYSSFREKHSEKPWQWMAGWIERWTEPGDLVLDLYAGMAPLARACVATGRRYLGAEIDPVRHRQAVDRLALFRRDHE